MRSVDDADDQVVAEGFDGPEGVMRFAVLISLLGTSCVFPGGELCGEVTTTPDSWAFVGDDQPCRLETSAPDPRSVRVGCYSVGDQLYIHSHRWTNVPRLWGKSWVEEVDKNASVRIAISGRIYLLRAKEISDRDARSRILVNRGHDPPPDGMRLFRFEARTE
jgi:hypothetical protein